MCGFIGIHAGPRAAYEVADALLVLQHRGQDAAGIATLNGYQINLHKGNGLVRDVFEPRDMASLTGRVGIGHVRYPTAGAEDSAEAQPFYVNSPYGICLAHNGNLTNHDQLADLLMREDRRHLSTDSDSEVLLNVFAHELQIRANGRPTADQVFDAVETHAFERGEGGRAL